MGTTLTYNQLCRRNDYWYLVSWDHGERRGSLIVGKPMPREGSFHHVNSYHDGMAIADVTAITFFPEVRYQGHRAYPQWWHREEPGMLMCLVPINVGEGPTPPLTREEWAELGLTPRDDGYAGYIHVDDLAKIEGPPPEGVF